MARMKPAVVTEHDLLTMFRILGRQSPVALLFYLSCIVIRVDCYELQPLTWEQYDALAGAWRFPDRRGVQPIPAMLVARFTAIRTPESKGLVFTPQHMPVSWHPNQANNHWGQFCQQAGVVRARLDDVRHTWPKLSDEARQRLLEAMDIACAMQQQMSRPPVLHMTVRVVPYRPKPKKVVPVQTRLGTVIRRLRPVAPLRPEWPG